MTAHRPAALALAALALAACVARDPPLVSGPQYRNSRYTHEAPPVAPPAEAPVAQPQPDPYAHLPHGPNVVLLEVRGMTCPTKCVREVKEQLAEAPGVEDVLIDFDTKVAVVRVAPGTDASILPRFIRPPYSAHVVRAGS